MMLNPLDYHCKLVKEFPSNLQVLALAGSRAYGLLCPNYESDWDFVGIHFMDKDTFLTHPEFQPNTEVIRKQYDMTFVEVFDRRSEVSVDSFEWWKFITLWLKGSFVTYELLHFKNIITPSIPGLQKLMEFMRDNSSSRIGHAARGNTMHDWSKRRTDRKRCVMAYFRLLQALRFLQCQEFTHNVNALKIWYGQNYVPLTGFSEILAGYQNVNTRKSELSKEELILAEAELSELMTQVDRSLISTKLPDRVEKGVLEKVLEDSKSIRMYLIES
jgi:hypothetical protein